MRRRDFARQAAALAALGLPAAAVFAADKSVPLKKLGSPQRFDYAWLKGHARALAGRPFQKSTFKVPDEVAGLDWDQHQDIRYRDDHALWADGPQRFRATFFHLGMFNLTPVRMHELVNGMAQELAYDPAMFDYGKSGLHASRMPANMGFAGFRINFHADWKSDITAFQGASYFRAVGGDRQYGLSARGLAIDSGGAEEFPRFTDFWLEKPASTASILTVYALMDSPSVAGAYRFDILPAERLVMDVDAALYPRTEIERVGIAALTSMFQYGENDRRMANDWRPEIHDSDGLSMWAGSGEWLWRPLANPAQIRFSAFGDENPRGFGLLQRDRNFDHYQDDGVFYEKRPSLWVEPKASWGKGTVQLVELPTDDETNDNIVAFWTPATKPRTGEEHLYSYRLHWGARPPVQPSAARVAATRTGVGGIVGQKRKYVSWRFTIDFEGGDLALVGDPAHMKPVISVSRGAVELTSARPLRAIQGFRAMFDLRLPDEQPTPVEMRVYLAYREQPMSETWCYQWAPPTASK